MVFGRGRGVMVEASDELLSLRRCGAGLGVGGGSADEVEGSRERSDVVVEGNPGALVESSDGDFDDGWGVEGVGGRDDDGVDLGDEDEAVVGGREKDEVDVELGGEGG